MQEDDAKEDQAVDSHGITGWDKVDRLSGTESPVRDKRTEIQKLYCELEECDKRPLSFLPWNIKPTRGRFARTKHRVGHVGIEAVKR